jgi:hypothetical protein
VRIANGQEVTSPGKCSDLSLRMQGTEFVVGLYILPMAGCDVVLGIQWLKLLGPILWDFATLSMEFVYARQKCALKGLQQDKPWVLEGDENFKVFRQSGKGVFLQLLEAEAVPSIEGVQN